MHAPASSSQPHAEEISIKLQKVQSFLEEQDLAAVLLERNENLAWVTAGQVDTRVVQGLETGVAALLLTREGRRYYIAPNIEGPRLADEEFGGLGYEPVLYPWQFGDPLNAARELTGSGKLASDHARQDCRSIDLSPLRARLLPAELARFRTVGQLAAEATTQVLESLQPGISEAEMNGRLAANLLERGLFPSVLLAATDERILRYKHAPSRGGVLKSYGMLNLCARKGGMVVSITRFVHFGPLPPALAAGFEATARIHAALLHATREGVTSGELYSVARQAYAEAGAPSEINLHHQGGGAGYTEREWLILPGGTHRVHDPEAVAFNPSLRGAKSEETVLLSAGNIEIVTATPRLPVLEVEIGGKLYPSAGVLLR